MSSLPQVRGPWVDGTANSPFPSWASWRAAQVRARRAPERRVTGAEYRDEQYIAAGRTRLHKAFIAATCQTCGTKKHFGRCELFGHEPGVEWADAGEVERPPEKPAETPEQAGDGMAA